MPTGSRVRDNNVYGITTDNPLTAAATTFNSVGLANLGVIVAGTTHAVVTLDPLREFGNPEIVVVTVHTASATVATITRGQYGTAARSHPQGTTWVHAPIDEDFIEILTAATRPSNPYEGQFIFETDTNKLVGYGGVDWAPRDAGGQLGYAEITANPANFTTPISDVAGLSVAVTVGTGRRVGVTGHVRSWSSTVADDRLLFSIREGTTLLNQTLLLGDPIANNAGSGGQVFWLGTPSAGAHTYKISVEMADGGTGTLNAAATLPAFILVEDIGAA